MNGFLLAITMLPILQTFAWVEGGDSERAAITIASKVKGYHGSFAPLPFRIELPRRGKGRRGPGGPAFVIGFSCFLLTSALVNGLPGSLFPCLPWSMRVIEVLTAMTICFYFEVLIEWNSFIGGDNT